MAKIKRPTRLIAYDTDENRERRKRGEPNVYRLIRPRTIMYAALIALVAGIMLYVLTTRSNSHLSVLHVRAPLFTQTAEGGIRNGYTLRFSNKLAEPAGLHPRGQRHSRNGAQQRRRQAASRWPHGGPPRPGFDARGPGPCDRRRRT